MKGVRLTVRYIEENLRKAVALEAGIGIVVLSISLRKWKIG